MKGATDNEDKDASWLPNGDSEKVLHPSKRERADHGLCLEYIVTTDLIHLSGGT